MALVVGVDSSTQATKALLVDAETGQVLEERRAAHPEGTEVDPRAWLRAADEAVGPLLERADAVAVGGQQHGMVALDEDGQVVRDALLWNDTRSAPQAAALVAEMGGPGASVERIGYVIVASMTASKLRWVREHEPSNARRIARVLLPHDYVSLHLSDGARPPFTDRGDASGTGYYNLSTEGWDPDLVQLSMGHALDLPVVAPAPSQVMAHTPGGAVIAPGTGDNMAAALGLSLRPGDLSLSVGTSGVAAITSDVRPADETGTVTGFADATGRFLPMATTINASRVLDWGCRLLGVTHDELSGLALAAEPGAGGAVLLPYLDGERTPNRPEATGTLTGVTSTTTREGLARAVVEGLACSLADAVAAVERVAGTPAQRVLLIGGAARSEALRTVLAQVLGRVVTVPPPGEYVGLGAARQAAWALSGQAEPPGWELAGALEVEADAQPRVMERYLELKARTADW